jgi:DNA-directed RNA polymerase specialized sigma24 family protein
MAMAGCERKRRADATTQSSNAVAFEQLYVDHEPDLYGYLARRLEPSVAEDTVAEVFALAWQRFSARDPATSARTWLLGLALERLETRRDDELACLEHLASGRFTPAAASSCPHVADALAELDAIDRDMLTLHVWADVSHESVAVLTGLSAEIVHRRIAGAYSFVRDRAGHGNRGSGTGNHT